MKSLSRFFLIVLLLSSIVRCGGGGGSGSSASGCSALGAKVFGGESCNQVSRAPVVAIIAIGKQGQDLLSLGFCSGALVTLDDILTSAHCFTQPFINAQGAGLELAGFVARVGGQNGENLIITNLSIHPSYDGTAGSRYDLAMATLERIPNPPIGPLPILVSELTGPGSRITAFGYGTNDSGTLGELKAAQFSLSGLASGNLIVSGDGGSSICPGDSGGPAIFINSSGVSTLAGVNSFGSGLCESTASRLFGFVDLQFPDVLGFISGYAPDVAAG